MGSLALDDGEGNAVDEQHDIRTGIVPLVPAVYGEFLGHMEEVVVPVVPVDVFQIEAEGLAAAHGFGIAFAQQEGIVNLLTGAHQTVYQRLVQLVHSTLDVGGGELIFCTGVGVAVQSAQLPTEDIFQQNMVSAAPLFFAVLRGDVGISHGLEQFNSRDLACLPLKINICIHRLTPWIIL